MTQAQRSRRYLQLLTEVLLSPGSRLADSPAIQDRAAPGSEACSHDALEIVRNMSQEELLELKAFAMRNHVIVRAFGLLAPILEAQGNPRAAESIRLSILDESTRIRQALGFLNEMCSTLEAGGHPVIVIKSLDHWPDLGSDLDLYTASDPAGIVDVMRKKFNATLAERSWGDRLANKWNFIVPGLPELVELHAGRLGQTGEQTAITQSLRDRACNKEIDSFSFRMPAPEDRIVISTLQRMYRHFYIRLCDIVDNLRLLDEAMVDFDYLQKLGSPAGLWDGIATYVTIISDYAAESRGYGVSMPARVGKSAKVRLDRIRLRGDFLRIPILPQSLALYAGELKTLFMRGEFVNGFRLSLLPGLATAAALEYELTGSDKGIW